MKAKFFLGATTLAPGNGGIGRVARLSALALKEAGYAIDIVSLLDAPPLSFDGQQVGAMGGSKPRFLAQSHAAALQGKRFLYDSAGPARAHPSLPGLRRPYAVWIHGVEVWGVPTLRSDYVAVVQRAGLVLVNSHHTLSRAERRIGPLQQARVCWLATEQDEAAFQAVSAQVVSAHVVSPGPPTVLVLGRIEDTENYKGQRELVAVWEQVVAAVPEARLLIAGGGTGLPALRQQIAASPAAGNIEALGFVEEAEMEKLWQRASVFAMPSRGEGFGLVYIEAMRHGLPVVASTHDAGQEVNIDGETGFNISLDQPGSLADRLITLLGNQDLRQKMGRAGFERWRTHFHFGAFKARFLPLIGEFIGC